jgi:hypothetical protein
MVMVIGSSVHPSSGRIQFLTFGFLPAEMHPHAETDEGSRDERRRYDDSGQFNCERDDENLSQNKIKI